MKNLIPKSFVKRVTLANFVASLLCVLIIVGFNLFNSYFLTYENYKKDLIYGISNVTADFVSQVDLLRMDASFLASVPPIQGINRAIKGNGIDQVDNSTLEQWKQRLAFIFKEMLIAKPHYDQLRLIGITDNGRELVRVERTKNNDIQKTSEDLLQEKSSEMYYQEAIKITPGQVYLSEFSFNREWGKIEMPPKMVVRAVVPISDLNGKKFSLLVINMHAKKVLSALLNLHKQGGISRVFNSQLEPLITSTSAGSWKISEDINSIKDIQFLNKATKESSMVQGRIGYQHIVTKKIYYDPLKPDRFLGVATRFSLDGIYEKVMKDFSYAAISSILLVCIAMLILFTSIKSLIQPLQELRNLAQKLSGGKKVPRPKDLASKDDELSELALTFYDMADNIYQKSAMLNAQKDALDVTALVSEVDVRGNITYANEKFSEISKFAEGELVGNNYRILNSGYHDGPFFRKLWKTIASGKVWRGEIRNKRKDGSYYWTDSSIVPIKDENGRNKKYISIRFDITERKTQEEQLKMLTKELKNKQSQLDDVLENSPAIVYQFRSNLENNIEFTYISNQAYKIFEITAVNLNSDIKKMLSMVHRKDRKSIKNMITESMSTLKMFQWDGEIITGEKNKKYVKTTNIPRKNEDDSVTWNGILLDITKEKEMDIEFSHQKKLLESASRLASLGEISAGIAHEINNPLAIILLKLDDLKDDLKIENFMTTDIANSLEYIEDAVDRINNITGSLKDLSKERQVNKNEICNMNKEVKRSLNLVKELYRNKGIKISDNIGNTNTLIQCPSTYLHQILLNLTSNAKDALAGISNPEINIDVSERGDSVYLTVTDNGPGIAEEIKEKVFEPFFTTKSVNDGTGIGLSLCYSMIRSVGGNLSFNSTNKGTKFQCIFKLAKKNMPTTNIQSPEARAEDRLSAKDNLKILLIDDEISFLHILADELSKIGHEVTPSNSGISALEIVENSNFDIIISDLKMPKMTGAQFFKKIKTNKLAENSFKILMSGHTNFDEEEYEVDATIMKPFRIKSLESVLAGAFQKLEAKN